MKIAVFDPSGYHGHYAHTQGLVFRNHDISWFVHQNVCNRLTDLGIITRDSDVFVYTPGDSLLFYYIKALGRINRTNWDVVFFNTLEANWLPNFLFFLTIRSKVNLVLTIHNIHSFFKKAETKGLRPFAKQHAKSLALQKCRLNVYSEKLKACLLQYKPDANPFLLPYRVFDPQLSDLNPLQHNDFRIVIPGSVDIKRRDYFFVREIAERLKDLTHIRFVLLGKPYGDEAAALVSKLEQLKDTVLCYREFIDESEFERQMQQADIVWGPLTRYYAAHDAVEEYGVSKETGVSFAMIRYALPGLFPSDVSVMDEINSGTTFYSNADEFISIIMDLSARKDGLLQLKKNAQANALQFHPDAVRSKFMSQLNVHSK
ncbi:MAG TPA: hypothetical protein VHO72_10955 [Bacteroidales bacterium]|nr:hypothetical protein [Bacteroidales bacterium]